MFQVDEVKRKMKQKYRKVKIEIIKDCGSLDSPVTNIECSKIIFNYPRTSFYNGRKIIFRTFTRSILNLSLIDEEREYFLPLYLDAKIKFLPKDEREIYEVEKNR